MGGSFWGGGVLYSKFPLYFSKYFFGTMSPRGGVVVLKKKSTVEKKIVIYCFKKLFSGLEIFLTEKKSHFEGV